MASYAGHPISGKGAYIVAHDEIYDYYFAIDNSDYSVSGGVAADTLALADGGGDASTLVGSRSITGVAISLPDDEPSSVEAAGGLARGYAYNLWMRRGNLSTSITTNIWDVIEDAVYVGFTKSNPTASGNVRRMMLQFIGGKLTTQTSATTDLGTALSTMGRS